MNRQAMGYPIQARLCATRFIPRTEIFIQAHKAYRLSATKIIRYRWFLWYRWADVSIFIDRTAIVAHFASSIRARPVVVVVVMMIAAFTTTKIVGF